MLQAHRFEHPSRRATTESIAPRIGCAASSPLISIERRDLALEVGSYGRVASIYNLLSQSTVFGLSAQDAKTEIDRMREKVSCWQAVFKQHGVSERDIVAIAPAMLAPCFDRTEAVSSV